MKKLRMMILLSLVCLLLAACSNEPAVIDDAPPETLLGAEVQLLPLVKALLRATTVPSISSLESAC